MKELLDFVPNFWFVSISPLNLGHQAFPTVLVHSGCNNKNNIDWVAYRQQKYISHGLEAGKSKIKIMPGLLSD